MNLSEKLKYLIENKGVTAYEVSQVTGVSQSSLSRVLSGKTDKISLKNRNLLAKYFNIDSDYFNSNNINEPKTVYKKNLNDVSITGDDDEIEVFVNKNKVKFFIFPNDTYKIEVPMIPFKAYASSDVECYFDETYCDNEFSKVQFTVDKIGKGSYLGFRSQNDSMNGGGIYDTPSGAEILAREIGRQHWKSLHKNELGFILMTNKAIRHKDIIDYNDETGMFTLHSRNPEEEDFEENINDVFRIFNVIKRTF